MRRLAVRLLLCVLLVLNGTGYAVAATDMHVAHLAMAMAMHEAEAASPCHDAETPDNTGVTQHSHADCDTGQAGSAAPDCCQSSQCVCDCLQHATAAMAVVALPAGPPPGGEIAQPGVADRRAPPLPNLLRPPIT